jgi:hypothetical protein
MPAESERSLQQRYAVAGILGAIVALLAGCASTETGTAAATNPLAGAARAIGVATTEPEPPEFVRAARPATAPEFIPVGVTPPPRGEKRHDPEALKKLEAELDAQRGRSRSYASRPAPKSSYDGRIPPRPVRPPKELTPQ